MGRREDNKAFKRSELERAALELFTRQGFAFTSVEQIVAGADVARGTFYLYFEGKDALFKTLIDKLAIPTMDALQRERDALVTARSIEETKAIYAEFQKELVGLILENPGVALLYFHEARTVGPMGEWLRSLQSRITGFVSEMLAALMERGLMRQANPTIVAHALLGAVEQIAFRAFSGAVDLGPPGEIGEEVRRLFGRGLLNVKG